MSDPRAQAETYARESQRLRDAGAVPLKDARPARVVVDQDELAWLHPADQLDVVLHIDILS